MRKVMILNGPNLDRLGTREPEIYGSLTLTDIEKLCHQTAAELELSVDFRQTNEESELIKWLHEAAETKTFVIINPAAFTHYSVAIRDAAAMLTDGLIEVHLSNPISREEFRHTSLISGLATGTISGFGANSYVLAIQAFARL
jgi:3-dehydroquinate dehydratase-2